MWKTFLAIPALTSLLLFSNIVLALPTANQDGFYIAHRGYSGKYTEGTKLAFEEAIKNGASGIEFDIRQTRDRKLVVSHNENLEKISGIDISVTESTLNQLKSIKLYGDQEILTLREAIKIAKEHGNIPIWPEIKESQKYKGIISNFIEIIQDEDYSTLTTLQSFNLGDLDQANQLDKELKLFKLKLFPSDKDLSETPDYIDYIGIPIVFAYSNPKSIKKIHLQGKKVILWRESAMFEKKEIIKKLIKEGADGFMTDYPIEKIN